MSAPDLLACPRCSRTVRRGASRCPRCDAYLREVATLIDGKESFRLVAFASLAAMRHYEAHQAGDVELDPERTTAVEAVLEYLGRRFRGADVTQYADEQTLRDRTLGFAVTVGTIRMHLEVTAEFLEDTPVEAIGRELEHRQVDRWMAEHPADVIVVAFAEIYVR